MGLPADPPPGPSARQRNGNKATAPRLVIGPAPTAGGKKNSLQLEDGEIADLADILVESTKFVSGQRKGFGEQAKEFCQVKSAENRASGAGVELEFHKNLMAASEVSVSEEVWSRTATDWMCRVGFWNSAGAGQAKGEEDCNRILALGPWSFDGRPLLLKPWSSDETYEMETVTALSVWVRFPGLNLHMRSKEILSMIASMVGKPIRTDGFTASSEKLSYARVLIEIYASNEFKREVCVKGPRGMNFIQRVEYDWLPPRCSHCQSFGHLMNRCPFPQVRIEGEGEADERIFIETNGVEVMEVSKENNLGGKKDIVIDGNMAAGVGKDYEVSHASVVLDSLPCEKGNENVEVQSAGSVGNGKSIKSNELLGRGVESSDSIEMVQTDEPFTEVKRKFSQLECERNKSSLKARGGVLEAKISLRKCEVVAGRCCPTSSWRHFSFGNDQGGRNRILLLWDSEAFNVNIWFACEQGIICEVIWRGKKFMAGFVYASNSQLERVALWQCINDAMNRVTGPWIWSGDFNCLRLHCEKLNGARVRDSDVRDIASLCDNNGLSDITFSREPIDQNLFAEGPRVKEQDCINLVRDVSLNEVADIVQKLPMCKAAGPDGFNSEFFKSS
ncbi:hypothetical protein QQ045_032352 [Rhodiola kirilowii]